MDYLIPNDKTDCLQLFVLDPLSVIIKLSIISNKPVGTKMCVSYNIISHQEPGLFQGMSRYLFKNNKTDIHYLYEPIKIACKKYLSKSFIKDNPKIIELFKCSQKGLVQMMDTYKNCSVILHCLYYYHSIIASYLKNAVINSKESKERESKESKELKEECLENDTFKDQMTIFYSPELLSKLEKIWTEDKILIVLNFIDFVSNKTSNNIKPLETLMDSIDNEVHLLLSLI